MKRDTRKRHAREYAETLRCTRLDLLSLISLNKFIPEYTGLVLRRRCSDNTCSIRHEDREVHFCHEDCTSRRSSSVEGVEGITYRTCDVVVIIKIHRHIGARARDDHKVENRTVSNDHRKEDTKLYLKTRNSLSLYPNHVPGLVSQVCIKNRIEPHRWSSSVEPLARAR